MLRLWYNADKMIKCMCNNKPCSGTCRVKNLNRKRKTLGCCPAAAGKEDGVMCRDGQMMLKNAR